MTTPKDGLPGLVMLMLSIAFDKLDRAAEAQSLDDAKAQISKAKEDLKSLWTKAEEANVFESD